MQIELSEQEIDLLKAGLSARKKRAKNRIKNELKRGKTQFLTIHKTKIKDIENLYSKLNNYFY
jgi:hypothetical protein